VAPRLASGKLGILDYYGISGFLRSGRVRGAFEHSTNTRVSISQLTSAFVLECLASNCSVFSPLFEES
jgi:hypothetical protein